MAVEVDLHKALVAELKLAFPALDISRRYMPRIDAEDLDVLRVAVYYSAFEHVETGRSNVVLEQYSFGIAVQKHVTDQVVTDANGDPVLDGIDNRADGDSVIEVVSQIRNLWVSGPLRDRVLAGCSFISLANEPPFEPLHLLTQGVYSSIIDVTYQSDFSP